jgi:long-chain acyl-CoA synthetase
MAAETIPHRVLRNAERLGATPAYYQRGPEGWEPSSWEEYGAQVRKAGAALVALGVEPGQPAAILGGNRPEWVIFDVGAMAAGAVPAGIYTTSSPSECAYILNHSEAPVLLVEDAAQWEKIASVRDQLPHLRHVVTMRATPPIEDPMVLSWDEFCRRGQEGTALQARLDGLRMDAVGTFIYTSGTTGRPKAVMLTHDNLAWTAAQAIDLFQGGPEDRVLSYLPLAHIAEQMFTIHIPALAGVAVYYADSIERLLENLCEVRPTIFFGVPRVWEKFHAGVTAKLAEATGAKAKLARRAMEVGREVTDFRNRGQQPGAVTALQHKVFDHLVYSKVKAALGLGEARLCASGAAPVSAQLLEFFAGLDLPIYEVYGQSEDNGPTSFNVPGRTRFGTVGPPFPGVEVKVGGGDGEVLVRGRNVFAGYYKDEEATAEALHDGWLHSGDLGEFDDDGFLTITGRKKDIIITAGGKNVAPKLIEGGLKDHPLVSEAVVVGDRRRYLTCLVTLDAEVAGRFMTERDLTGPPEESAEVRAEIEQALERINLEMGRVEQVKKFTILPRELSIAEGELTPTLKVKRNVVTEHFAGQIDAMYAE